MIFPQNINTISTLEHIATLTSIRDIELFEVSFVKTVAELLTVKEIYICKFDKNNTATRQVHYISENKFIQIKQEDIEIPELILTAAQQHRSTNKTISHFENNLHQTVFSIDGLNGVVGYLLLILLKPLSEIETLIISSLLNIAHNFYSLLEENQKDKLTGLLNRKTFDDNISKIQNLLNSTTLSKNYPGTEKRSLDNNEKEFWLAILDIDHFKKINDTFGHIYGDEVLLLLSQLMKKSFRPNDLLFRFGGEEFVIVAQVNNQQTAKYIFERFCKNIENFSFPQVGKITISGGAIQIIDKYAVSSDIVGKADKALYYAKKMGRNRLYFFENLVASGILKDPVIEGENYELF